MIAASETSKAADITEKCKKFNKFEFKHIALEGAYNDARQAAVEDIEDIDVLAFELEKNAAKDASYRIKSAAKRAGDSIHQYVVNEDAAELKVLVKGLETSYRAERKGNNYANTVALLKKIREILQKAVDMPQPDFFSMGFYIDNTNKPLPANPVPELNKFMEKYMNDNFMDDFITDAERGIKYSAEQAYKGMEEAVVALRAGIPTFKKDKLDRKECKTVSKALSEKVKKAIDGLAIVKDSLSYTFAPSIESEIDRYFTAIGKNKKAEKVYAKNKAKFERASKNGKDPGWKLAAAAVTDLDMVKDNICHIIERLAEHYEELLSVRGERDYKHETGEFIDYLKTNAGGVVAKVTKRVAKTRAIKLMEEVGIAEPRKRYNQYPFEFSGGMRQRIVIAIALAANPDILICDEPTTALDVTIQSQILELINRLKRERQLSVIFITHDLGVVANMADRVAVMYAGKVVEYGTSEDVFYHSAHPYTWALLSSMPDLDTNDRLEAIPGTPPNLIYPPVGDAFAPRNKYAMQIDYERQPPMFKISDTHYAATWLLHPDAPKVEPPKAVRDRIERMKNRRVAADAE